MADQLYGALDSATQRSIDKERDVLGTNGTNSMSASLRGSNSSLNSMPGGVISMCLWGYCMFFCTAKMCRPLYFFCLFFFIWKFILLMIVLSIHYMNSYARS
jgi:hypothetical protein